MKKLVHYLLTATLVTPYFAKAEALQVETEPGISDTKEFLSEVIQGGAQFLNANGAPLNPSEVLNASEFKISMGTDSPVA